mmetsp:Transcript_35238/g.82938  ORF Transcript_35238/g.82938 Transcript_35238/m.82938 type:complete len:207 (-) Transcript_35238:194-814(-)
MPSLFPKEPRSLRTTPTRRGSRSCSRMAKCTSPMAAGQWTGSTVSPSLAYHATNWLWRSREGFDGCGRTEQQRQRRARQRTRRKRARQRHGRKRERNKQREMQRPISTSRWSTVLTECRGSLTATRKPRRSSSWESRTRGTRTRARSCRRQKRRAGGWSGWVCLRARETRGARLSNSSWSAQTAGESRRCFSAGRPTWRSATAAWR